MHGRGDHRTLGAWRLPPPALGTGMKVAVSLLTRELETMRPDCSSQDFAYDLYDFVRLFTLDVGCCVLVHCAAMGGVTARQT